MKLLLKRVALKPKYTIGHLYIDGAYFCDTIEDKVRDLNKNGVFDNGETKVYAETAIPYGTYEVTMKVQSPKFSKKADYNWWKVNGKLGYIPRLLKVNHFEGILIHAGRTEKSSAGCIIIGQNKIVGQIINSMETCKKLYPILLEASNKGDKITIEIV